MNEFCNGKKPGGRGEKDKEGTKISTENALSHVQLSSQTESRQVKFFTYSTGRVVMISALNNLTSKIQQSVKTTRLFLCTVRPNYVTKIEGRQNIGIQVQKKNRAEEKLRDF